VKINKHHKIKDNTIDHVRGASKQASLFAQLINKDIISMNNIQGQAARKAHKAQHCWPPCKKIKLKNKQRGGWKKGANEGAEMDRM